MQSVLDNVPVTENLQPVVTAEQEVVWPQADGVPADLVGPIRFDHPLAAHIQVITENGARVLKHTQKKRKKVCIVGYAENSRHEAFYNDPDCEIWGVNQLYRFIPRADRWFQIHKDWNDSKKWATGANLREWLTTSPIPVYMIEDEPSIPNAVAYPLEWVRKTLDVHTYFTSSIAMMVALAIAEGFEEIGLYGIDLIVGREWAFEKPCVEFFLGIAHARGIKYHLPSNSALLWQSHLYGYQEEPDYGFYNLSKLQTRAKALQAAVQEMRDGVHKLMGRMDEAELLRSNMKDDASKELMSKRIAQIDVELGKALNNLYMHDGAQQEVARMFGILELRSRGGSVA